MGVSIICVSMNGACMLKLSESLQAQSSNSTTDVRLVNVGVADLSSGSYAPFWHVSWQIPDWKFSEPSFFCLLTVRVVSKKGAFANPSCTTEVVQPFGSFIRHHGGRGRWQASERSPKTSY
ncbi:hypothetical protein MU516_12795 [Paracoccus sp. YLB-12]|uniref:Uncharacterized protein n=1 Tax=Paracoccus maritimus TaxID=2933292 RepID=A0ABT2KB53_9RHOB|nr:hypothetical protein [Paracoccus sp. YLB-12]MCT4333744.1 hypothetical protein [Paracoccus sp. YLB-12]